MPIPKIIHYCWFGPKPIPYLELNCIESWKKFLPDYKLMFWNESTFDVNSSPFTKQAYENKYYAFVSDFVRASVLAQYGGIYLDTDFEILADFTNHLHGNDVILCFENKTFVGTAMMAFVPNHPIIDNFLDYYKKLTFLSASGKVEITANPSILANILIKYGFELNGQEQEINGVKIFHRDLFFPKKLDDSSFRLTEKTIAIHHFTGSWLTPRQKRRGQNKFWIEVCRPFLRKCKDVLILIVGSKRAKMLENNVRNWLK